ncbi:uncharacterized protein B0T15DRAFT_512850 [Chaetomium strumarium]|uniref:Uncharacterized protein n=1 Tax=Chaetomium strumarium TaxID=1170767 RepID=A0AAJ0GRC5_9PEZI|nr:hypothetical protein B0T15DRAFT_512850 [Chaetomium strumarium]
MSHPARRFNPACRYELLWKGLASRHSIVQCSVTKAPNQQFSFPGLTTRPRVFKSRAPHETIGQVQQRRRRHPEGVRHRAIMPTLITTAIGIASARRDQHHAEAIERLWWCALREIIQGPVLRSVSTWALAVAESRRQSTALNFAHLHVISLLCVVAQAAMYRSALLRQPFREGPVLYHPNLNISAILNNTQAHTLQFTKTSKASKT